MVDVVPLTLTGRVATEFEPPDEGLDVLRRHPGRSNGHLRIQVLGVLVAQGAAEGVRGASGRVLA